MYLMGKFNKEGVEGAIEHFKRAVELDPQYAQPHVGLADAYFILGQPLRFIAGVPPMENLARSKVEATIATQLDDSLASAHSLLGIAKFYHDWDWKGAESEFRKALELDANSTSAHLYYALFLTCSGRHQQAAPHIRRALELDPLRLSLVTLAGELYADARNYDEAFAQVQKVLELDPNFDYALSLKTSLLIYTGRGPEALAFIEQQMKRKNATAEELSQVRAAFSKSGMQGLFELFADHIAGDTDPLKEFPRASYYSRLGNADSAMESLEKAYAIHDGALLFLRVHPAFEGMQEDPRFEELTRRIGIPRG
jgi:tetratricopeptide (TPR) repeat protein